MVHDVTTEDIENNEQKITTVNVHFLGFSQDLVGIRNLSISFTGLASLKDLLKKLAGKLGKKFREHVYNPDSDTLFEDNTILINGRHYSAIDGLESPLKSGDDVSFFPPLGGG